MKKSLFCLILSSLILGSFYSCASLQEDKLVETESGFAVASESASFEDAFREFDSVILKGSVVSMKEMDRYCSDAEKRISSHTEPALIARMQAYEGLVMLLEKKTKKAQELYASAKALQSGDEEVLLLNARLQSSVEDSLKVINEYLTFDSDNPVFLLERGILQYKNKKYSDAVASFDSAFLIFEQGNKTSYRERYGTLRDNAWKLFSSGAEEVSVSDPAAYLSCQRLVAMTLENSSLLEDFGLDAKATPSVLVKKLEGAGFFSAVGDSDSDSFSSREMTSSSELTRTQCARFLWNVYIRESGNTKMRNAYSSRYSRLKNPSSPIEDLLLSSIDFDACLGVVEKEIMHLADGRLFEGNKPVSELEFLEYLKNCEKALK